MPPELEGFISDDDYMEYMTDSGAMSELFPETVKSVGVHNVWADIDMGDMRFRRLDREIIERFSPRMESGSP